MYNFTILWRILDQVKIIGWFFNRKNSFNTPFDDSSIVDMIYANNINDTITVLNYEISSL